jgi:succinyl-CoA synthetase beta subunit
MAKKKIREYHAKALIKRFLPELLCLPQLTGVLVTAETNWKQLRRDNPWLENTKLVAKPDMMFGQRGKHGLVLLDATIDQAIEFVTPWFEDNYAKVASFVVDSIVGLGLVGVALASRLERVLIGLRADHWHPWCDWKHYAFLDRAIRATQRRVLL